eukprot:12963524-Ditylum_brightwellii.AAC.1
MKSFKTLCAFVSLILEVCASKAIEEPQRGIRGLTSKGGSDAPGDTSAPKGSKGGTDTPSV